MYFEMKLPMKTLAKRIQYGLATSTAPDSPKGLNIWVKHAVPSIWRLAKKPLPMDIGQICLSYSVLQSSCPEG